MDQSLHSALLAEIQSFRRKEKEEEEPAPVTVAPPPPVALGSLEGLSAALKNQPALSDVICLVGKGSTTRAFYAHRLILALRCPSLASRLYPTDDKADLLSPEEEATIVANIIPPELPAATAEVAPVVPVIPAAPALGPPPPPPPAPPVNMLGYYDAPSNPTQPSKPVPVAAAQPSAVPIPAELKSLQSRYKLKLEFPDDDPTAFELFLTCVYTGNPTPSLGQARSRLAEIIKFGDKYGISLLREAAVQFINALLSPIQLNAFPWHGAIPSSDADLTSVEQGLELISLLQDSLGGEPWFAQLADNFKRSIPASYLRGKLLESMDESTLSKFLQDDSLCLSEVALLRASFRWARYQLAKKYPDMYGSGKPKFLRKHLTEVLFPAILPNIRLPTLDVVSLAKTVGRSRLLPDEEMLELYNFATLPPLEREEGSTSLRYSSRLRGSLPLLKYFPKYSSTEEAQGGSKQDKEKDKQDKDKQQDQYEWSEEGLICKLCPVLELPKAIDIAQFEKNKTLKIRFRVCGVFTGKKGPASINFHSEDPVTDIAFHLKLNTDETVVLNTFQGASWMSEERKPSFAKPNEPFIISIILDTNGWRVMKGDESADPEDDVADLFDYVDDDYKPEEKKEESAAPPKWTVPSPPTNFILRHRLKNAVVPRVSFQQLTLHSFQVFY